MLPKSTSIPSRISLESSSKMSLHDRFTKLAKTRVESPKTAINTHINRVQLQASAKNRRLALQMANRPSVQAALKIKNRSIKQRLGRNMPQPNQNSIQLNKRFPRQQRTGVDPSRLSVNGAPFRRANGNNLAQRLNPNRMRNQNIQNNQRSNLNRFQNRNNRAINNNGTLQVNRRVPLKLRRTGNNNRINANNGNNYNRNNFSMPTAKNNRFQSMR